MSHASSNTSIGQGMRADVALRRAFLRTTLLAPAAALTGVLLTPQTSQAAAGPGRHTPSEKVFNSLREHARDHVTFLEAVLGSDARPFPRFADLEQDSNDDFVFTARALENLAARAYLGALPYVLDQSLLSDLASIALVLARHAGYLNTYVGYNVTLADDSFESPLDDDDVREAVDPYINDLNGGPPLAYFKSRSNGNDTNILNFALCLAYLMRRFYNLNVPKFGDGFPIQPY
jgi:hypothetical protein